MPGERGREIEDARVRAFRRIVAFTEARRFGSIKLVVRDGKITSLTEEETFLIGREEPSAVEPPHRAGSR